MREYELELHSFGLMKTGPRKIWFCHKNSMGKNTFGWQLLGSVKRASGESGRTARKKRKDKRMPSLYRE